jgi:hypothetical protein
LERKGFGTLLRNWIMSTIRGGRVCININSENESYFKTYRGLRQVDPLSPLMFNLAADALDHMLLKSKEKGLRGMVAHLIPGGA